MGHDAAAAPGTPSLLWSVFDAPDLLMRRQAAGAPQRDMTTASPWTDDHSPYPWGRLPRCGLNAHALQQEPGNAHGHRGDPKERPLAAGRFDEEARDAGSQHRGRLHGHRRQTGVGAKLRVRAEVEHQWQDIDQRAFR